MDPDLSTKRWLWHERTAWLLMMHATALAVGLTVPLHLGETLLASTMKIVLVCSAIMACVCDSLLAGRPMPYSWRFPMVLLAPMLPVIAAILLWRSRRWWGLLWFGINLCVLVAMVAWGAASGFVIELLR